MKMKENKGWSPTLSFTDNWQKRQFVGSIYALLYCQGNGYKVTTCLKILSYQQKRFQIFTQILSFKLSSFHKDYNS